MNLNNNKLWIVLSAILLSIALMNFLPYPIETNKGLALLFLVAVLWLTEAIHITITALLVPFLAVVFGLTPTKEALEAFANPTIYLFFGGFAIASALSTQHLDQYIANRVLSLAKGNFLHAILLMFMVTALLSMGISNTATAAMMIPLGIGMLRPFPLKEYKGTYAFVLLGIAYSANIGGMGTVVGSPPNAIVVSNIGLSFTDWLKYGTPVMIGLMPLMILVLYLIFRPDLKLKIDIKVKDQKLNRNQYITIFIFALTAFFWLTGDIINPMISSWMNIEEIKSFDTIVAIGAVILIATTGVSPWKQIQKDTDWGVLLLFGGGLTLSSVLISSGASKTLVDMMIFIIEEQHFYLIGLLVAFFVIFLTEFTSNTASAALLVPIFISIARALGMNPLGLSMIVGLGASCAFMLPVATPPNAIAYGTGLLEQKDMVKAGIILNLIGIIFIASVAYMFWF
ncbi:DASS family sodium-coupled anion symporter [Flavobacteriaceae bacterium Ap0902]|nr:DASS family sodium-coupled anion symporter [Flavobacteriaceae bacterium Ap0902]